MELDDRQLPFFGSTVAGSTRIGIAIYVVAGAIQRPYICLLPISCVQWPHRARRAFFQNWPGNTCEQQPLISEGCVAGILFSWRLEPLYLPRAKLEEAGSCVFCSCGATCVDKRSTLLDCVCAIGRWRPFDALDDGHATGGRLRLTCGDSFLPISVGEFPSSLSLAIYNTNQVLFASER